MNKINIGILGLGNVGVGTAQILKENFDHICKKSGAEIVIKKILVSDINKDRGIVIDKDVLTTDAYEILNDPEISIVVELIGGLEPAFTYIKTAMQNKKHVVSANKLCIAENMNELFAIAKENDVMFKFEASVAGGIPIINGINSSLTANEIESIIGIINGTTNFILTSMTRDGKDFDDVLKEAQDLGFAEADPTSDVENYDAKYKLKILTKLAFGHDADEIYTEGITSIGSEDIKYAKQFGYTIKSLAIARVVNEKIELRVTPSLVKNSHPLANVSDSFNALFVNGNAVGELMFYGRGAGSLPTGSAVVSDLIHVVSNCTNTKVNVFDEISTIVERDLQPVSHGDGESKFYIRLTVIDEPGVLALVTGNLATYGISIKSIIQKEVENEEASNLVIFTDKVKYNKIGQLIEKLKDTDKVLAIKNVISIL